MAKPAFRIGSLISLPMGLLLLVFFFLPWVTLTCDGPMGGMDIGRASGLQLTLGTMTPADPPEVMGEQPEQTDEEKAEARKKMDEGIDARPWFALGLAAPVLILVIAGMSMKGPMVGGVPLLVLGVVGILVVVLAANVSYVDEMVAAQKADEAAEAGSDAAPAPTGDGAPDMDKMAQEMMQKALKTEGTTVLWLSLAGYALVTACGMLNLVMVMMAKKRVVSPAAVATTPPAEEAPPAE